MIDVRFPVSREHPVDPDPEAVRLVQETRERRETTLSQRGRWASVLIGGSFLAAGVPLALLLPSDRSPSAALVVVLVVCYAIAARVEFDIAAGTVVPTELLLVPMLFALPVGMVPLAVAAAMILSRLPDYLRGRVAVQQVGLRLVSSWHAIGPALVLGLVGERGLRLSDWPLYVAALAAQFAVDLAAGTAYQQLAYGLSPRAELPAVLLGFGVDTALAPIGLAVAIVAAESPYFVVLVLPLVGLLAAFARQRRSAIDGAVALGSAYRGAAELLVELVEDADAYTGDHSRQIVDLVVAVAEDLGVDARGRRDAELAALLHDVGKWNMLDLVRKPAGLTAEERDRIETHTVAAQHMLARVGGLLDNVGEIVRSCHERWDGQGYPDGLAGEEIPLVARIVACCDAYNAMTTDRPYRLALADEDALYELRVHAGTQFDPGVVDALVRVLARAGVEHGRLAG